MKKLLGVLLGLVVLVVVGVVGVFALSNSNFGPLGALAQDTKTAITNAALDATDVKGQVKSAIDAHRSDIAAVTGLSDEQVDSAIESLAIDDWQAATLPEEATATGTVDGSAIGVEGTLTTYDDPGYVTLETMGQTITLEVPESAQQFLPLLGYAQQ